jgi:hypothetical protein
MGNFNKEIFLSELASKLESYCKMKNKDIHWYEHNEWDRDDLDLDISKCKKYCYVDHSYVYQGSYNYCDSCENILQTTLKLFNLSIHEIGIYINSLNDKIKMLEEKIDNLKILEEKIDNLKMLEEKTDNLKMLEEKTDIKQEKTSIEINNVFKINGIGIVLVVSTKSNGELTIGDKYTCIDDTNLTFIVKGFEHEFLSTNTITHPYDDLRINVRCKNYNELKIGHIFV